MKQFLGRDEELKLLQSFLGKESASFLVIRGRRRIGKSRLIEEFAKGMPCAIFSGLAPDKSSTRETQLDVFAEQMATLFDAPKIEATDWGKMFWLLGKHTANGRIVLAFDEISWMGSKDPTFLGYLKEAWDRYFSKNPELIFIVCGSVSSWITENILSATGFLGRISYDLQLDELPLKETAAFWGKSRSRTAPYEMLKILSITGGVPRYLEELLPKLPAEENIRRLCFTKGGLLVREFDQIFSDLFNQRAPLYADIVRILSDQASTLDEVCAGLKREKGGAISGYLKDLLHAGFIAEDNTWNLQTGKISQLKRYRLSDNYLRFYLRYIAPNRKKIIQGVYKSPLLTSLPNWEGVMGLQFENLVLHNMDMVLNALQIDLSEISMYGPFFQRATKKKRGCQIDLLIQSRYRVLYLCEIKFSANPVDIRAVQSLEEKRQRLSCPRGWSTRTVLIHVNGFTQGVRESQELDHIIDFSEFLK